MVFWTPQGGCARAKCEQTTSLAGLAAMRPGLGTWQELLEVEGQSLAATEEGDHIPASLSEEQHKSQPGPLINAGCSQLAPVTNTSPVAHSATDRHVRSPGKEGNKASSSPWIRAHSELLMATTKL